MIETTSKQRSAIRKLKNASNHVPVFVIPGSYQKPILSGEYGGYFTKGGARIDSPNAYAKKGWSNMEYRRSTLSIAIGEYDVNKRFKNE
jgi:hypothetical protein